jgi:uncharacterized delta-60 repeat protein
MQFRFGRKTSSFSARPTKRLRPRCEALEDRRMLSAGDLDPTFGSGGVATSALVAGGPAYGGVVRVEGAVDPSGRIVVVGQTNGIDMGVARYNPDGSLDATFGKGGIVDTSLGSYNPTYGTYSSAAHEVAIDPATGKILVLGNVVLPFSIKPLVPVQNQAFVLARYNTDGTLDTTFGNPVYSHKTVVGHTGYVTTLVAGFGDFDEPRALAVDSRGRIVIEGYNGASGQGNNVVLRYTSAGSLDKSFGSGGKVAFGKHVTFSDMQVQSDDKIVVATLSQTTTATGSIDFAVYRFTASGAADASFGTGGVVTTDFGQNPPQAEWAQRVLIQADGDIVAVGSARVVTPNGVVSMIGVARYTSGGQLDPAFGSAGLAYGPAGVSSSIIHIEGAALDELGRVVVVANDSITRFTTDGMVDATFEPPSEDAPALPATVSGNLFLASDHKLYEVAGTSGGVAIARFLGDSAPPLAVLASNSSPPAVAASVIAAPAATAAADAALAAYEYPLVDDGAADALARGKR